jgi:hypothetical protein
VPAAWADAEYRPVREAVTHRWCQRQEAALAEVHPIPANPAKREPRHQHFDLRYAFTVAARPDLRLQADEVSDFAWLPANAIEPAALAECVAATTLG